MACRDSEFADLHEYLVSILKRYIVPGARAVDLGSGTGAFASRLRALGADVKAVDIDCAPYAADAPFVQLDLNDYDFPARLGESRYDLVTAVEVIEHLENPIAFMRNVRRLLRGAGVAVITTPNVDCVPARIKFLMVGKLRMLDEKGDPGHITPIFVDLLTRQYVPRAGLRLVEHQLFPTSGFRFTRRRYVWACRVLAKVLRGGCVLGDNHVLILQR